MTNTRPWFITCREVTDRERALRVVMRDSEVVVVVPPGEITVPDHGAATQVRSAVKHATEVAATPAPAVSGAVTTTSTASTVEQNLGWLPLTAEGRPALPSCRGGTTTPMPGPAAIPSARGEGA
ncbi:hypothetical protein HDA45_006471 [Amycolatopsis umgeniensis]|uniref:Uncharacterized protein n=1 Tax=Amycolatopsis umgeniensis TaxID=336628 RepID=A0A841BD11_9PSEU|nr:hypothetical protein [Amycolatopsis umgeniensis]